MNNITTVHYYCPECGRRVNAETATCLCGAYIADSKLHQSVTRSLGRRSSRAGASARGGGGARVAAGLGIALLALLVGGIWLLIRELDSAREDAQAGMSEFHQLYAQGEFAAIWTSAHPVLQQTVSRDDLANGLRQMKSELGEVNRTSLGCLTTTSISGRKMVRAEYAVHFEHGIAWETYDWLFQASSRQLIAFAIEAARVGGGPVAWEVWFGPPQVRPQDTSCNVGDGTVWWELRGWPASGP